MDLRNDAWVERIVKLVLKERSGAQLQHLSESAVHALWDQAILNAIMQMDEGLSIPLAKIQARVTAVRARLGMIES